ncbi:MAG: DUF47 family protein [Gemmatimonadetes bacterium]|nr:DUF47 family protein [Gemmatimonadota bacterium]
MVLTLPGLRTGGGQGQLREVGVRLIPRDEEFFSMFGQLARRLQNSAALLKELLQHTERMDELVEAIKREEHAADNMMRDIVQRINSTFVTPIDREDIYHLGAKLDNVIDLLDGAARRAQMFRIQHVRAPALQQVDVLIRAAAAIEHGVVNIKKRHAVEQGAHELKAMEEEADAIYHAAIGELFDGSITDAIEVIRWKEMFDKLEDAMDECEDVANVLEGISLKHM